MLDQGAPARRVAHFERFVPTAEPCQRGDEIGVCSCSTRQVGRAQLARAEIAAHALDRRDGFASRRGRGGEATESRVGSTQQRGRLRFSVVAPARERGTDALQRAQHPRGITGPVGEARLSERHVDPHRPRRHADREVTCHGQGGSALGAPAGPVEHIGREQQVADLFDSRPDPSVDVVRRDGGASRQVKITKRDVNLGLVAQIRAGFLIEA